MKLIDFARARIAWTTHGGSHGFWRIVAAARRVDGGEAWFLAPGVMAGDVYAEGRLPMEPAYSFQFIASRERHVMLREPAGTAALQDTDAPHAASFSKLVIEADEVQSETLASGSLAGRWPLTARIAARGASGARWLLEFPVNHINLRDEPRAFQVETGPVVVPLDLIAIAGAVRPAGLQLAFVFFSRPDRVDLLAYGSGTHGRAYRRFARLEDVEIEVATASPAA